MKNPEFNKALVTCKSVYIFTFARTTDDQEAVGWVETTKKEMRYQMSEGIFRNTDNIIFELVDDRLYVG